MIRLTAEETAAPARNSLWTRLKWLFEPWVEDVPETLEFCEYECRLPRCTARSWDSCELRLSRRGALVHIEPWG